MTRDAFSSIPQVERILEEPRVAAWFPSLSRPLASRVVSETLEEIRSEIRGGGPPVDAAAVIDRVDAACRIRARRRIRRVTNATGIILHTNLGRSPISPEVWQAAADTNTGYANLELDLETGKRGRRSGIIADLLGLLTGCEAALVVNNNAAAVLLVLTALASGREVVVSRGEQVQIGGGFRIPEILALSGARLLEVGTTNITTLDDYLGAVTPGTAMVLVVHPSNFAIRGFTEKPDLAEISRRLPAGVLLVVDQGSGTTTEEVRGETKARAWLRKGAHLVCFSADKVLGGPQAGIVAGDRALVERLAKHPFMRAMRPGKTVLSLLEEHLVRKLDGTAAGPAERALALDLASLERMGRAIIEGLPPGAARLVPSEIATGGGASPDESHPSLSLELVRDDDPQALLAALRALPVPIIATIEGDRVRLALATMHGERAEELSASIRFALASVPGH